MQRLNRAGYLVFFTNRSGVARGFLLKVTQALKFHQSPQPAGKGVEIQSKFGFVLPKRQKLTLL
jgi:hypothetical protein